jgi:hypothetical protein
MSLYHRFKDRFGTAGVIIGVIALILALGGTALAASKLNGTQKKEVAKIAKKEAQKYANSNPGAPGQNGTNGKDGTNGTNGTNGKGLVASPLDPGEGGCTEGGVSVEVEGTGSPESICNGEEGAEFPGGGVLPSGATERGTWGGAGDNRLTYSLNEETHELEETPVSTATLIPISFPLPVQPAPEVVYSKQLEEEDELGEPVAPVAGCPGLDGEGLPLADPGKLCVYQKKKTVPGPNPVFFGGTQSFPEEQGADSMGTEAAFTCTGHNCFWVGVWAVTAE